MAPKSATSPVAIALARSTGGEPSLAAVFAILAGILGAVAGPALLRLVRVRDPRAEGLAVGVASHGIGSSRMVHEGPTQGAFAGLGLALSAVITSVVVPILVAVWP